MSTTTDHATATPGPAGSAASRWSAPPTAPTHPVDDDQATTAQGPAGRPRWERPALAALLLGTALLYLWGLSSSGWANTFYAAAAQAGSESWKAFFFGSSDAANSITVDKTPLALWPMDLSVRVFGLSSWALLVPQALEGVAAVALLTRTVRRTTSSAAAGLLAGAVLALTPVAVLMFRFDNPDAMLVLLLVGAAAATLRSVEPGQEHPVRWLSLAGALVGLAFLAKMLQAFLVLPAFALVYLVAARTGLLKRLGHLAVAGVSIVVAGGWWVAIVSLWPAASRPYIGGSQHNSILELTLGYNGLGRLSGDETGSVGGGVAGGAAGPGGNGGGMWGSTGITRLVSGDVGGQAGWLLPTAVVLLGLALWLTRRSPRTDPVRAALVVWGGWLLVTGLTFSFMAGIFHAYYTVALAPAVAALVALGAHTVWQHRTSLVATVGGAVAVGVAATTGYVLLGRSPDFLPGLRWLVLLGGLLAALAVAVAGRMPRRLALVAGAAALLTTMAGPASYAVQTAATAHTGSIPTAGPAVTGGDGMHGGPGGRPGLGGTPPQGTTPPQGATGTFPGGGAPGGAPGGAQGGAPGGTPGTPGGTPGGTGTAPGGTHAGMSGLLEGSSPSAAVTAMLTRDARDYTWVAAAVGSNSAAGYQLATQGPVMAVGGFNGSDPSPTLAQFKAYVAAGEIHWFIGGGGFGRSMGGSGASSAIASWVEDTFASTTVDGVTLYDLTQPASGAADGSSATGTDA
jgi:4-amino-4-deoxy-L-arabinose transferase-like glycosyltransferase